MKRIAFVFPGQGAQEVGMGIDVAERFSASQKVFDIADATLGFSIREMIQNGPEEDLKLTINTQPAIVTASIAMLEGVREMGYRCEAVAGHSVGEYTALYCAGVLSAEDCISLTRSRGEYMHEAGQKHPGTLAAIIGLEAGRVEELCREASSDGVVVLANLNCPGQLVVSGEKKAIETLGRLATEAGATKVMPLAVSAAFHSPLMNEAAEKLARRLDQVKFSDASIPVYCNVTGDPVQSGEEIRKLMKIQITSRVQWEKGIRRMMADGIDTFVEIGPGKALSGMIKRIDRKAGMFNFYNMSCADKLAQMESEAALTRA